MLETITSRKNKIALEIRALGCERHVRQKLGLYVCDGRKLLEDALAAGAAIKTVLWGNEPTLTIPAEVSQYRVPPDLLAWISPLKNSPGPIFTVAMPRREDLRQVSTAVALENVQDPGNVGTVLRTANALGVDVVVLIGTCADLYHPKTIRATMGAIFRQRILETDLKGLYTFAAQYTLPLYGAALTETAKDVRSLDLRRSCVAIGSEGQGLSRALLDCCVSELILPMESGSESLNAAVAAALVMWQMRR